MKPGDRAIGAGFLLWRAFCTVLALVVLGVGIWAVVEIVQWLTAQDI